MRSLEDLAGNRAKQYRGRAHGMEQDSDREPFNWLARSAADMGRGHRHDRHREVMHASRRRRNIV